MSKITKQDVEDALEVYEDLPEGAQFHAAADDLGLDNVSDLIDILDPEDKP